MSGVGFHGLPIEHQVLKELGDKKKTLDTPAIRKLCREYAEKFYRFSVKSFSGSVSWEIGSVPTSRESWL